jgi:type III secretory pathway component EscT
MSEYIIGYIVGIVTTIPFWTACYFLGKSRAYGIMIEFLDTVSDVS